MTYPVKGLLQPRWFLHLIGGKTRSWTMVGAIIKILEKDDGMGQGGGRSGGERGLETF